MVRIGDSIRRLRLRMFRTSALSMAWRYIDYARCRCMRCVVSCGQRQSHGLRRHWCRCSCGSSFPGQGDEDARVGHPASESMLCCRGYRGLHLYYRGDQLFTSSPACFDRPGREPYTQLPDVCHRAAILRRCSVRRSCRTARSSAARRRRPRNKCTSRSTAAT